MLRRMEKVRSVLEVDVVMAIVKEDGVEIGETAQRVSTMMRKMTRNVLRVGGAMAIMKDEKTTKRKQE